MERTTTSGGFPPLGGSVRFLKWAPASSNTNPKRQLLIPTRSDTDGHNSLHQLEASARLTIPYTNPKRQRGFCCNNVNAYLRR